MGEYLSKPDTKKYTTSNVSEYIKYTESSMQGWRVSMEDAHICKLELGGDPRAALFAVFDGHGGAEVARFCGRHFEEQLLGCVHFKNKNYAVALQYVYLLMDELIASKEGIKELHS